MSALLMNPCFSLEQRKSRGPDKEFLQKLDSVSYQLSSLDQDLQSRVQAPLPHTRPAMDRAHKQQLVSLVNKPYTYLVGWHKCSFMSENSENNCVFWEKAVA